MSTFLGARFQKQVRALGKREDQLLERSADPRAVANQRTRRAPGWLPPPSWPPRLLGAMKGSWVLLRAFPSKNEAGSWARSWARKWSQGEEWVLGRSSDPRAVADQRAQERAGCHPLHGFCACFAQRRMVGRFQELSLVQSWRASWARKWSQRRDQVLGGSSDGPAAVASQRAQERGGCCPLASFCACLDWWRAVRLSRVSGSKKSSESCARQRRWRSTALAICGAALDWHHVTRGSENHSSH